MTDHAQQQGTTKLNSQVLTSLDFTDGSSMGQCDGPLRHMVSNNSHGRSHPQFHYIMQAYLDACMTRTHINAHNIIRREFELLLSSSLTQRLIKDMQRAQHTHTHTKSNLHTQASCIPLMATTAMTLVFFWPFGINSCSLWFFFAVLTTA